MNPSRHARVSQLFLEAVGLPPDERDAFLEQECGSDAELLTDVQALISQDGAPAVVDRPVIEGVVARDVFSTPGSTVDPVPQRIGRYDIIKLLGRGGMGAVYEARQTNPVRHVAVKVVHPMITDGTFSRRVEYEAQVLARLQHPGIAQIFEAGVDESQGRPVSYFAMELVQGLPLDEFLRKHKPPLNDRLRLFLEICDAVNHAHQNGVIHRDLKPANILVDKTGRPKVLDFGIARVTDADIRTTTLKTNVGQLLGTVAYMSPEQISADPAEIDTRSDVYALGVLAHEMLSGKLPYDLDRKSIADAAQIIRDRDPSRLGTINRSYRGDIETIIGKALEKDKTRRYATVAEFAADIRHYLRHEPISARPPSIGYQIGKFARRNRALVGGIVTAFCLLIVAVIGTSYGLISAQQERDKEKAAREALFESNQQLSVANAETKEEKDKYASVNTFLRRMFESANPMSEVGYASKDITVLEMLDHESKLIGTTFAEQPEMEAALRSTFGDIYMGLGRYREAEQHYSIAKDLHWKTGGFDTYSAQSMSDYGSVLTKLGRTDEAINWYQKALSINRKVNGEDSFETGLTESRFGYALMKLGQLEESETAMRSGLEKLRRHAPKERADNIPRALNNLAKIHSDKKEYVEAERLYGEALEGFREFYGENHAVVGTVRNSLARMAHIRGDFDEAETGYREAARILQAVAGDSHPVVGTILNNLANLQAERGELIRSIETYRTALDIYEEVYGRDHGEYISTLNNCAFSLRDLKRWKEAADSWATVVEFHRKKSGDDFWRVLLLECYIASCRGRLGEPDGEVEKMRRAYERLKSTRGLEDLYTQKAVTTIVTFFEDMNDTRAATEFRQYLKNQGE